MNATAQTLKATVEQVKRRIPRLDARLLMQYLLGITHAQFLADPDRRLSALCRTPVWTVEHFRKGFSDTAPATMRPVRSVMPRVRCTLRFAVA